MITTEEKKAFIRSRDWWTDFCMLHRCDGYDSQQDLCYIANGHYGKWFYPSESIPDFCDGDVFEWDAEVQDFLRH